MQDLHVYKKNNSFRHSEILMQVSSLLIAFRELFTKNRNMFLDANKQKFQSELDLKLT